MILVIGGSGSGKSSYAEERIASLAAENKGKIYYLATMTAYGEESRKRIQRHRLQREGKGMITLEQPRDVLKAIEVMEKRKTSDGEACALLEDMGNLVANEMFCETSENPSGTAERRSAEDVAEKVLSEIMELDRFLRHFVIVTNNVFEDGMEYDEGIMEYIRAMGIINATLAKVAKEAVELVVGIPVPFGRQS